MPFLVPNQQDKPLLYMKPGYLYDCFNGYFPLKPDAGGCPLPLTFLLH